MRWRWGCEVEVEVEVVEVVEKEEIEIQRAQLPVLAATEAGSRSSTVMALHTDVDPVSFILL